MLSVHLRTFAAGAAFTLVVSAATSFGAATPKVPSHGISTGAISAKPLPPVSRPSDYDRLLALIKRVDKLQNQLVEARSIALEADAAAGDAQSITSCITTAASLIERADGTIVGEDAGPLADDALSITVPTLDDSCVESS
jgi:hypothetical protein